MSETLSITSPVNGLSGVTDEVPFLPQEAHSSSRSLFRSHLSRDLPFRGLIRPFATDLRCRAVHVYHREGPSCGPTGGGWRVKSDR